MFNSNDLLSNTVTKPASIPNKLTRGVFNFYIDHHGATACANWAICSGEESWYRCIRQGKNDINIIRAFSTSPALDHGVDRQLWVLRVPGYTYIYWKCAAI